MNALSGLPRVFVAIIVAGAMLIGARYALSEGIRTIIASQPPAVTMGNGPSFAMSGCDLGLTVSGARRRTRPCRFESYTPQPAPAIKGMSKAESARAGLWFFLAAIGLPLALGGAAVAGLWLFKTR